jgi:hypothetical protein
MVRHCFAHFHWIAEMHLAATFWNGKNSVDVRTKAAADHFSSCL